jgi:hypothetical protein
VPYSNALRHCGGATCRAIRSTLCSKL